MGKVLTVLLLFASGLILTGCDTNVLPERHEVEEYEVMQVLGADTSSDDPTKAEITFLSERASKTRSGQGGGGTEFQYSIISSSAATLLEADRLIKSHSDKKQFFGYVDYVLIGEAAAKDDFSKYFDFPLRDHEIRLSPKVYIVKGGSVKAFIEKTTSGDRYLGDRLENIDGDIGDMSNFGKVNIVDVAGMLNNEYAAAVIPVLKCEEVKDERLVNGTLPEQDAASSGFAVIKDFKLVGFIDEPVARGYNFLVGKVKSSAISVQDQSGRSVGLEVINENTSVEASFNGDTLERVLYKAHIYSNIDEQQSREDITSESSLEELCAQQSDVIRSEMEQVIGLSKEFEADCIGLGEKLRMLHPYKWEKLKAEWRNIYPKLKIEVQVTSDIRRTYDIHEPEGYRMGREQ